MAEYSEPYDQGTVMAEESWTDFFSTFQSPGVDPYVTNALEVYSDNDGRQVKVRAGKAYIKGHRYRSDAVTVLPIAANSSGSTRNDYVVLRYNRATKSIRATVLTGPNGGALPGLTQGADVYDLPLAKVAVPNNFASIVTGNITDVRSRAGAFHRPNSQTYSATLENVTPTPNTWTDVVAGTNVLTLPYAYQMIVQASFTHGFVAADNDITVRIIDETGAAIHLPNATWTSRQTAGQWHSGAIVGAKTYAANATCGFRIQYQITGGNTYVRMGAVARFEPV